MRNLYFKSKSNLGFFVLLIAMLLGTSYADAQVRVNFNQRTSQYTPTKKIYNVKGDFAMIGNSNMTLQTYEVGGTNSNSQMVYSDVDGDANTLNSSNASLALSTENGANPACSNIIYAGLYWTGRAHNGDSPNTFNVTKNGVTKSYDKHRVSFKGPGAGAYATVTASNTDIYYPTNTDGGMYSAYAEVTDYVKTHGVGSYTVADIAIREGDGGSTGYYGGWSLIVVYENSKMKYRDVTVFDGHAYVAGSTTVSHEIPVAGFNTVQAGPVNLKLGMMAGEGDRSISGDYFQVRNAANTAWVTLNHSANQADNFFNSSILTGGNTRNPNLANNTGLDIAMFNINNPGNSVIANNQTSTRFRYGSTQDTFVIFAVAMSVDAYIPDVEAVITAVTVNGQPAQNPLQTVLPGQEMEYKVQIKNKGTEPINNFKIMVPVPYNSTYVAGSAQRQVFYNLPSPPSPNALAFNPSAGSNGAVVWDYGTLPLPTDPETLIAELTFKFKATTDCTILKNLSCSNVVAVDGILSGAGAITGISFNEKNLIQGFTAAGSCQGNAIAAPILISIDAVDYVNQNCQATPPVSSFVFCSPGNNIQITSINGSFPPGTRFYNQFPVTGATTEYTINNPFPATIGTATYYAVPPNSVTGCYFPFNITVTTISSQPTASDVSYCVGATAVPLTATPSNPNFTLYYYATQNGAPQLSITPSTAVAGSTTYYVAEGQSAQCIGPKKPIVVNVYPTPTLNAPANATLQGCSTSAISGLAYSTTPVTITLAQLQAAGGSIPNSGVIGTYTLSYTDGAVVGTCPRVVTRTFSIASTCGTLTAVQIITIQDTIAPVIANLPPTSAVSCPAAPQFAQATATDNCGGTVTLTYVDVNTAKLCLGSYSITRNWTATDACGNTASASQTININDTTPPVIAQLPAPSTIICPAQPVFTQATATDSCGSEFTLSSNDVTTPGSCPNSYSITRTWTAVDGCGNAATATQTITVIDNTAPVISQLPAPATVNCSAGPIQWTTPTATDSCGGTVTLVSNDVTTPGACAGSYTTVRTWTATDVCGNIATATQSITVQDNVGPVIAALPAPSTISCPATPAFATATATDACGSLFTLTFADNTTNGTCAGSYTTVRTWTATDACGNTSTASQSITVADTTAPVIAALPAPSTISCPATPAFATATATDACGSAFTLTFADNTTNGTCAGSYTIVRTWTATDACGNIATASQSITVTDTVAPVISQLPAPTTISCPAAPEFAVATATDACGSTFTLTFADNTSNGTCAGSYTTVRTWTATDACGNTSTASQSITVTDTVAPVIAALPAPSTISCPATPAFATATATDACGSTFTLTFADNTTNGTCAGSYTTVRTWTATDACGNTSTASQSITVTDTVAPVISQLPAPTTINCPATPVFATATATDACGSAFTLTFADNTVNGSCASNYAVTRTWTAVDACGNTSTASQTINVQDIAAPTITTQASNLVVECDGSGSTTALNDWLNNHAGAVATDTCSTVTWTNNFNGLANDCSAAVTVVFTATDACGNFATTSATFTVQDTTNPVAPTAPAAVTGACAADVPANIALTATDNCAGTITAMGVDATVAGSCPNSFVTTRTWTFTDACNNSSSISQIITISDTVAPVAPAAPAAITGACAAEVPAMISLTATDNCQGAITVQGVDVTVAGACPNSFVTTRTWTFADACNNTSSVSQVITISDTVAPVAPAAPAAITGACAAEVPAMISLTATDNCQGAITVQGVDVTVQGACPNSFVTTRTWTFVDACNNTSSVSQVITISDTLAPVAPAAPAAVTVACAAEVPAMISLTATDNCQGAITVAGVDSIAAGSCANNFVITRTWSFADVCGNTSSVSQTITVNDNIAPVIAELPAVTTISCPAAPAFAQATATDNCAGTVALTFADATTNGTCAGTYSVTRTWTATDVCGNTATATQTINVEDTTAPVIAALPAVSTIDCPSQPAFAQATATDACGSEFTLTFADVTTQGTCANAYSVTRTWTAADACGNTSTATQTINVQDISAPTITTQASNIVVECDGSGSTTALNDWLNNQGGAVANDTCSDVVWTNNFNGLANDCSAAVTVIFTATDACGNFATTTATFTVEDTTNPVAPAAPASAAVVCAADVPANIALTATDNCSGTIEALGVDLVTPGSCANSYVITRTWTFVDACNNTASISQTITVNDTVAPVAPEAPAAVTVACAAEVPAMISLTAADNCGEQITVTGVDAIAAGECVNSFVVTRTWTFVDACGNTSSATQTITVNDTVAPVIAELPAASTVACPATPAFAQATATDNCAGDVTLAFADATTDGQCAGSYSVTRTWTATDACGNTATATQTINVEDTTAPVIAELPAPSTITCPAAPVFAEATATDACASAVTLTFADVTSPGQCASAYSVTRTWTATDACGNTSIATQTISVQDVTPPVISAEAADLVVECDGSGSQTALETWLNGHGGASATDACSIVTWTNNFSTIGNDCSAAVTVIFTATDACGNASSTSATFTIVDTTAPAAPEAPAAVTVACASEVPAAASLTATDDCAGEVVGVAVDTVTPGACANSYVITRTWTFTDTCNNASSVSQTITVSDTVAPVAPEAPAAVNVSCASEVPAMVSLTATDNCDDQITAEGVDVIVAGACANSFVVTRTWTFTDVCGNTSSVSQTINVNDTEAPVAPEAPAAVTLTCAADLPAMISLIATDNCGDQISAEGVDSTVAGSCPNSFVTTRTWTFTDVCGNTSSVTQIITVADTVAPVAPAAPANIELVCAGELPAMVSLTATDNCGETITVEGVDVTVQGSCPNSFVTTRTWTFADACGNISTAVQTITVNDTVAPELPEKIPVDITLTCAGDVPPMSDLTATDNCGEVITVTGVDTTVAGSCVNSFVTTRIWTFIDACGNEAVATQVITVNDTVPPTFNESAPADISVSCDAVPAAAILTATDNCNGGAIVVMTESTNAGDCAGAYILTRTWTATDACGNIATTEQDITVADATAPTFDQAIPTDISVECDAIPTAPSITATDNCGAATVAMVETTTPGACPSSYTLTRTWTATDVCGNPTVATQIITVIDSTAPFANETFDAVVNTVCAEIPAVPSLTFGDNCSVVGTPTFVETVINQTAGGYTIVRTWTVDDACGNVGTFTQTVNVSITDSVINLVADACFTDETPFDLNSLLPVGTPAGIWVDVDATGRLNGSILTTFEMALGFYSFEYQIADPDCPRVFKLEMEINDDCPELPCELIVVHNAFSPNGDGLNEFFSIENLQAFECYPTNKVEIYNRWGVMVFDTTQYDNAANSFKGISEGRATVSKASELPTGTYFYILEYTDTTGKTYKKDGYLYLSR